MARSKVPFSTTSTVSYVAVPGAFKADLTSIQNSVKLEFANSFAKKGEVQLGIAGDRVLLDFRELYVIEVDFQKIIADCDFIKGVASKSPEEIKRCLASSKAERTLTTTKH